MSSDLLSRSLKLLLRHPFLLWLGMGMRLSRLLGIGWRLWLAQVITINFSQLTQVQSVESLLFNNELAQIQPLFLRGLLLVFAQLLLVWLLALVTEAGLITAVSQHTTQPINLRQTVRWGQQWLGRFLAIDLIVFLPWFLLALLLLLVVIVLTVVLASFASSELTTGTILAAAGLGLACLLGLAALLIPVGMASFWFRLLVFREAVLQKLSPRTAVRQTWRRIRKNLGEIFTLIIVLWGGQTLLQSFLGLLTSPLLTWLAQFITSDKMALQAASWLGIIMLSLFVWLLQSGLTAVVAIAWTLAYQNLQSE